MLLYLATAPVLPPCLKIAVNYKCSLNVSSDPEMQVGVRRRDQASPSLKRARHYFFLYHAFFNLPFFSPHTPCHFFVFFIHFPPILLLCSFRVFFFFISSSLPLLCGVFCGSMGARRRLEDRGLGSFSPTHERTAAGRHRRPRL